jgi:lysozyme
MNDMRVTSEEGKALIKKFEGCELQSYLCSASKLTIGYGHTGTTKEGMEITQEEAESLLDQDLQQFESIVNDAVKVPLEQCEFDALIAWTSQMRRWNKATVNGEKVVLAGLERRREAEALLWQGKDWYEV